MDKNYFRKFALAIFLDKEGNAVIQDRRNYSKSGETFGLYGGGIEEGETSDQAIVRELKEELDLNITYPKLWKEMEINIKGHGLGHFSLYIFPINKELKSSKDIEGKKYFSTINKLKEFKEFDEIDKTFFKLISEELKDILNNYI